MTPKKYKATGWTDRFLAIIIDLLFLSLLGDYLPIHLYDNYISPHEYRSDTLEILYNLESFLFYPAYFILLRIFYNGQTLGKKLIRIKTVSLKHEKLSFFSATLDCLGYLIWPLDFFVGVFFSKYHNQRMTQMISDTQVVYEEAISSDS